MAVAALFVALGAQLLLAAPVAVIDGTGAEEEFSTGASIVLQTLAAAAFVLAPLLLARMRGADWRGALRRLGVRGFGPMALVWMLAAVGAYFLFAIVYVSIAGEPEQEDIAEAFGPLAVQVVLVVFAASISEELAFRGMLFGGLRERLPRWSAALISAAIFGALHAVTGISAVPPLIAFGFILAYLYEKTGSIVPGIILHMLNNSAALAAQ